jgi:hypothetical protein
MTVDPKEAFKLRSDVRAHLYGQGDLDLHDAVDPLQETAPAIGQDVVQDIMGQAFKPVREREWSAAAPAQDKPPASAEIIPLPKRGTAQSTIDTLLDELHQRA